jgi:hypothetical protein
MTTWPRQVWDTVRLATVLGAALMGVALVAPSVRADTEEMAVIETRATIDEDSDGGVNAALKKALERAIRGAAAMGLEQVQINGAFRAPGYVVVQILATPSGGVTSREGRQGGAGGPAPLPPVFPPKPERF